MPHAALCVSRRLIVLDVLTSIRSFNAARSIVCVETTVNALVDMQYTLFQCRTQHCVCRDMNLPRLGILASKVSMPHAALCVSRRRNLRRLKRNWIVSMPHAALCVSRQNHWGFNKVLKTFQCRTQHCVCRDAVSRSPCPARAEKAFWKDALFCAVFGVCG